LRLLFRNSRGLSHRFLFSLRSFRLNLSQAQPNLVHQIRRTCDFSRGGWEYIHPIAYFHFCASLDSSCSCLIWSATLPPGVGLNLDIAPSFGCGSPGVFVLCCDYPWRCTYSHKARSCISVCCSPLLTLTQSAARFCFIHTPFPGRAY